MRIGIDGEAGLCMTQDAGQGFGVYPIGQCMGSKCVAQVVEADIRQIVFFQDLFQLAVGGTGIYGCFRMEWIVEDPGGVRCFFAKPQQLHRAGRQDNAPGAGAGLGIPDYQSSTFFFVECAADAECSFSLVKVRPHKPADFSQPKSGGQLCVEEVVPDGILFCG